MRKYRIFTAFVTAAALAVPRLPFAAANGDPSAGVILIGDSRTEGMHEAVGDAGCLWEYASGEGYNWMTGTGVPEVEQYIGNGTSVVVLLGVNDVGDTWMTGSYAAYLNEKAAQWRNAGARTYYAEVTRCSEGYSDQWGTNNENIAAWNQSIRSQLSGDVQFLDVGAALGEPETVDGLHYTQSTYQRLFQAITQAVPSGTPGGEMTVFDPDVPADAPAGQFADAPVVSGWYSAGDDAGDTIQGENTVIEDVTGNGAAEDGSGGGLMIEPEADGSPEPAAAPYDDMMIEPVPYDGADGTMPGGALYDGTAAEGDPYDGAWAPAYEPAVPDIALPSQEGGVPGVVGSNETDPGKYMTEMALQELEEAADTPWAEAVPDMTDEATAGNGGAVPGVVGTNDPPAAQASSTAEPVQAENAVEDITNINETPPANDEGAPAESGAEPAEEPAPYGGGEAGGNSSTDGGTKLVNLDEAVETPGAPGGAAESRPEASDAPGKGSMLSPLRGTAKDTEAVDRTPEKTGWQKDEYGNLSYYMDDGSKATGVEEIDGGLYHFDAEGKLLTNGLFIGDHGAALSREDGRLETGWKELGGKEYLFLEDGYAATGMTEYEGRLYGFDYDGSLLKGIYVRDGKIYVTGDDGAVAEGWTEYQGNTYYSTRDGALTGAQSIDGRPRLFDSNGRLLGSTDGTDGGNGDEAIGLGWQESRGVRSYILPDGTKAVGWQKIEGGIHYFDRNGVEAAGPFFRDHTFWMIGSDGTLDGGFEGGISDGTEQALDEEDFIRAMGGYTLAASYPESTRGDALDTSKVKLTLVYGDGREKEVDMFTVGDLATNPVTLEGDTMLTIDSPYGKTQLDIILKKAEKKEDVEKAEPGLHASYRGLVYEGEKPRKSLISVTYLHEDRSVETVRSFETAGELGEIMEETVIPIRTEKGETTLTINPVKIEYVEPYAAGIRRAGETIDPEELVFGYSDGTYRRVPASECEFAMPPSMRVLAEGMNEYYMKWKGKEFVMRVSAIENKEAEQAAGAQAAQNTQAAQTSGTSPFGPSDLTGLSMHSLGTWRLTGYADTPEDQGPYVGQTASGAPLVAGRTVAVSSTTMARHGLNFGDRIVVNGHIYVIEDHGGSAMAGQDWVDIYCGTAAEGGTSLEYEDAVNGYAEVFLVR